MAKRRPKIKFLPARIGEMPTEERCNQLGGIVTEVIERDANGKAFVMRYAAYAECMLDTYLLRGLIDKVEHVAGMRYRIAWLRAREGLKISDRFSGGVPISYEDSLHIIPESERILKEAAEELTPAQKAMVMRICVDNATVGGTDSRETLCRGLRKMAKRWRLS